MNTDEATNDGAVRFASEFDLELPEWAREAIADHELAPLVEFVTDRCTSTVFPIERHDPGFTEALGQSVDENVHAMRDVLVGKLGFGEVPLANRLKFANVEAELRVSQASMQRSYRVSFFLQWQEWSKVVAATAVERGIDPAEGVAVQQSLTALVLAYADSVVSRVALSFARSEEALNRSRAHIRQRLVREVLDGDASGMSPADLVTLDYSLDGWHVAIMFPDLSAGAAEQIVVGLRGAAAYQHSLVYPIRLDTCVAWLGTAGTWSEQRWSAVVRALEASGVRAFVSEPAIGLEGFQRGFAQVCQIDVSRPAGAPEQVLRYSDLRLEILLMQNLDLAAEFVAHELGPLAARTAEAEKLRTTLEASYRLGSHVAAAEHLQLHEHTVRNRLQKVTELLGPIADRRTEIQVALRLHKMLADG